MCNLMTSADLLLALHSQLFTLHALLLHKQDSVTAPKMYCYPDIDEAECGLPLDRWLPLAKNARPKLETLLSLIKTVFANAKAVHTAVGAACKAATHGNKHDSHMLTRCCCRCPCIALQCLLRCPTWDLFYSLPIRCAALRCNVWCVYTQL